LGLAADGGITPMSALLIVHDTASSASSASPTRRSTL
jgi:hypothetical protein